MKIDNLEEVLYLKCESRTLGQEQLIMVTVNGLGSTETFYFDSNWKSRSLYNDTFKVYYSAFGNSNSFIESATPEEMTELILPYLKDNYVQMLFDGQTQQATVRELLFWVPKQSTIDSEPT